MPSKQLANKIFKELALAYPNAKCELLHQSTFQLLIATILSAQCTDAKVNQVTPKLFAHFPDAYTMAQAELLMLESLIRPTGFFHNKAKNILACAQQLVHKYQGQVPDTMSDLTSLPGVGRKTANVVLGNAFDLQIGIVVDTHVQRITQRLGLTTAKRPEQIEQDLMLLFPRKYWAQLSHLFIFHGRRPCSARSPQCSACPLQAQCAYFLGIK